MTRRVVSADVPGEIRLTESELASDEKRLANLIEFIGEGRGSDALASALAETERRIGGRRMS